MKKLFIITLSLGSLMLFSFIPSKNTANQLKPLITKTGPMAYSAERTAGMQQADEARMKEILTTAYGIKDFKEGQIFEFKTGGGKGQAGKWWAISNKKWGKTFFKEKLVAGEGAKVTSDIKELDAIIAKYTDKGQGGTRKQD